MDNRVSGLLFFLLGSLALFTGLSAKRWQPTEARMRVGTLIVGIVFIVMGILGLLGYIEITGGS